MAWLRVHQYLVSVILLDENGLGLGWGQAHTTACLHLFCGSKSKDEMNSKEKSEFWDGKTIIKMEQQIELPMEKIGVLVDILRNEKGVLYETERNILHSGVQDVGVNEDSSEGSKFYFDNHSL